MNIPSDPIHPRPALARPFGRWRRWRAERRGRIELDDLSDRMLRDIGLPARLDAPRIRERFRHRGDTA